MGFIKSFSGALGSAFADQWKDYLTVPASLSPTAATCIAATTTNSNQEASTVITNGSLILVPEGFSLITLENGNITGYISEPGGYVWESDNINSRSIFSGSNLKESLIVQTWERFKYGGTPFASQVGLFINMKEIPNNRFGTQGVVYYDDAFFNTQVGIRTYGTYTIRIENPILFVKKFLPVEFYSSGRAVFDLADIDNPINTQLFNEVVASLAGAFSAYANGHNKSNRITNIQRDNIGFAQTLSSTVEKQFHWLEHRGIHIDKANLISIDYDENSKELLAKVQQADALMGPRGNSNLQASFAAGLQAAGESSENGLIGMGMIGLGMQPMSNAVGVMQQATTATVNQVREGASDIRDRTESFAAREADPYDHLIKLKELADMSVITQEEFDTAKQRLLDA